MQGAIRDRLDAASRQTKTPMDHIAQVTLPTQEQVLFRFDNEKKQEIEDLEEILGNLAEEGLVYGLEFHTSQ